MATSNIGFQSFYQSQLTSAISNTDLTIPLDVLPTPSEGYLVIESTVSAQREIIYYTSKTGTAVVVPSGAGNGRGFDGTTAVSHTQGATVIMAPIGAMFGNQAIKDMLGVTTDVTGGWDLLASGTPSTITALGNRSYTVLIPSADTTSATSVGMRLKLPRTVTAPTGSITLNGTTQYANKTSPTGMTFTDDFTVSAWIKQTSYGGSNITTVVSRQNGTSGWSLDTDTTGQVRLLGYNAGGANVSYVKSYQSIPLNKWVHITAQLDMSTFTATTTTSYVMIDGVNVPVSVTRGGTNPTALIQAGNLEIGSVNGGTLFFPGQIAQVAIYSAKVTQATILASMNQTLTGSETSLVSAYKLDQASGLTDLSANANNLTAQGSPSYASDTPFTNPVTGTSVTAGTTNYGIIMAQTFSTNTTYTIQIPEGETLPTTGGIGTVSYSTQKIPYGYPTNGSERTDYLYNPYKFSVYRDAAWNTTNGIGKVSFDAIKFDTSQSYSTSATRFNVPVDGYYQFNASVGFSPGDGIGHIIYLYKNGVAVKLGGASISYAGPFNRAVTISSLEIAAAGDYFEIYFYGNGGAGSTGTSTWFNGYLVSSL